MPATRAMSIGPHGQRSNSGFTMRFGFPKEAAQRPFLRAILPLPVDWRGRWGESGGFGARGGHRAAAARSPRRCLLGGARRILDYLVAGDVYQVNLARRLSAPVLAGSAVELAVALAEAAPAAHAAFIAAADGEGALLGNSPERFLASTPKAGWRPRPSKAPARALPPEADRAATAALLASAKDRAEHVMIVDLERNDLGRVCQTGTVAVASLARLLVPDGPPPGQHRAGPVAARNWPGCVAVGHVSGWIDHGRAQAARHADHR